MNKAVGGVGLIELLGLLFVALKLTGQVAWPWLYVTLPLWGPAALAIIIIVAVLVIFAVVGVILGLKHEHELLTADRRKAKNDAAWEAAIDSIFPEPDESGFTFRIDGSGTRLFEGRDVRLCGFIPPTPGYAPCTRERGHSGPCAHPLLKTWQGLDPMRD
jgi:hypothetical protein